MAPYAIYTQQGDFHYVRSTLSPEQIINLVNRGKRVQYVSQERAKTLKILLKDDRQRRLETKAGGKQ
jgi:hypothetical protein